MKKFYLCTLLFFAGVFAHAQIITNITWEDGLIDGQISSHIQTTNGDHWFGSFTPNNNTDFFPLGKFDGTSWTYYNMDDGLADNELYGLAEGSDGSIWIATQEGLSIYDGNSWVTVDETDGLFGKNIRDVHKDNQGNMWVSNSDPNNGTIYGISRFDGTSWTHFTDVYGNNFANAPNGDVWACGPFGLHQFNGTSWTTFDAADGLFAMFPGSIEVDQNNNIYVGDYDETIPLEVFDGTTFTTITMADGLADQRVRALYNDNDGAMWVGGNAGVTRIENNNFTIYDSDDGILSNFIRTILEDDNGNIWFGHWEGVSIFEPLLSINEISIQKNISIHPNPATSSIQLDTTSNIEIISATITNLQGQKYPTNLQNNILDVSNLSAGLYFITIETNRGTITKKFIKK